MGDGAGGCHAVIQMNIIALDCDIGNDIYIYIYIYREYLVSSVASPNFVEILYNALPSSRH